MWLPNRQAALQGRPEGYTSLGDTHPGWAKPLPGKNAAEVFLGMPFWQEKQELSDTTFTIGTTG